MFQRFAARFALVVSCGLMGLTAAAPAHAQFWQCAPYARMLSGIAIHGNANTWWGQAAGHYDRGHTPRVGSVLSFKAIGRMPMGHVATVSRIVSDREVLLTHANWSRRGGIETNVRAVDVSEAGDWSQVQVWFAPTGGLGTTTYPTNGFIYADRASAPLEMASANTVAPAATVPAGSPGTSVAVFADDRQGFFPSFF